MLVALLFTSVAAAQGNPPPQAPTPATASIRIHDLRGAATFSGREDPSLAFLPCLADGREGGDTGGTSMGQRGIDAALDLLRAWNQPVWESEGRLVSALDEHRLAVRAPAAEHDALARQIAALTSIFDRRTRIVVDVATFGPNPGVEGLAAVIPAVEVERWTGVALRHERHEFALPAGDVQRTSSTRVVSLLTGYGCEIASHSIVHIPIVEHVRVGTVIDLAAAPARGGVWIAANARDGRLIGAPERRDLNLAAYLTMDASLQARPGSQARDDARLADYSASWNAFLPDGKALVLTSSIGLETHVMFVQQVGGTTPPVVRLPDDAKRDNVLPETLFLRYDSVARPTALLTVAGDMPISSHRFGSLRPGEEELLLRATIRDEGDVQELFQASEPYVPALRTGGWIVFPTASRSDADTKVAVFGQLQAEPRGLVARLTLRRGSREGPVLARASVPLRIGSESAVVVGKEQMLVDQVEAEVAEASSAHTARASRSFDGLVCRLSATDAPAGGVRIDVDAHARWSREAPRVFDPGSDGMPKLQLQDSDACDDAQTITFAKGEKGPRRVRLGNQGSTDDALTIDIEVSEIE